MWNIAVAESLTTQHVAELKRLYLDGTKHSCYQNVPRFMSRHIDLSEKLQPLWRDDVPRLDLVREYFDFSHLASVVDVGANTGYFSLSLAFDHPNLEVTAIEGHAGHADFIAEVADLAGLGNIKVVNQYVDQQTDPRLLDSEVVLHFNVLHHLGVDNPDNIDSTDRFFPVAAQALSRAHQEGRRLVLQMGFNWGGDKKQPIVALDDDLGKLRYLERLVEAARFEIRDLALPVLNEGGDRYRYVIYPFEHIRRDKEYLALLDHHSVGELSEFFRRPIIFCRAKE
jgi:hypothetical protein